jgi:hypothetical protein
MGWWNSGVDGGQMAGDVLKTVWPRIFNKLDLNQNGVVSKEEIVMATGDLFKPIELLLQTADTDKDGDVTQKEWSVRPLF